MAAGFGKMRDHLIGKKIRSVKKMGMRGVVLDLEDGTSLEISLEHSVDWGSRRYNYLEISIPDIAEIRIE